jgi:hypothetical protein
MITSKLLPKKMEQIECSETSAIINQTPGNHPKEDIPNHVVFVMEKPCILCAAGTEIHCMNWVKV